MAKTPDDAAPQPKRIALYAGVGSTDYALMGGANAKLKRRADGSQDDAQHASGGIYDNGSDQAFPSAPQAFPSGE